MDTTRAQVVDLIFSLSEEQLEQLRSWSNENAEFEDRSKDIMNQVIDIVHQSRKLDEMKEILLGVNDSYEGFIKGVLNYVDKKDKRCRVVMEYLEEHPEALSSDILEFISDQEDFYEDVLVQ